MSDAQKLTYGNLSLDSTAFTRLSTFQRIQVTPQKAINEPKFSTLSAPEQQKLVEKLIKRVRSL